MAVVDAPELPPLLFNRNGKYTYVCSYENAQDTERHISVRVHDGQMNELPDDPGLPFKEAGMNTEYEEDIAWSL